MKSWSQQLADIDTSRDGLRAMELKDLLNTHDIAIFAADDEVTVRISDEIDRRRIVHLANKAREARGLVVAALWSTNQVVLTESVSGTLDYLLRTLDELADEIDPEEEE